MDPKGPKQPSSQSSVLLLSFLVLAAQLQHYRTARHLLPPAPSRTPQPTTMAPPVYIISRVADPIFAVVIGLSAAALRINREEKDQGRSTQDTIAAARRYV